MQYYRLEVAFMGTAYFGWQRQTNGCITVQQVLEDILRRVFRDPQLNLCGSSRTDTGVHAMQLTASFHTEEQKDLPELTARIEKQLPHDVRLIRLSCAAPHFSAQGNTCGKAYVYAVLPGNHPLFLRNVCWGWPDVRSIDRLYDVMPSFVGEHDFSSFTGRNMAGENPVRTIYRAEICRFGRVVCFYFSGSGFLNKMVRRLTGTLHEIAAGRLDPAELQCMLDHPEPSNERFQAPPDGLYLKKVFFSPEEWQTDRLDQPPFCM